MDRNQVIGIVLISALVLIYIQFFAPKPSDLNQTDGSEKEKTEIKANAGNQDNVAVDTLSEEERKAKNKAAYGQFADAASGNSKDVVIENKDIRVVLSNKGAEVKSVLLKDYLTDSKQPLYLIDDRSSNIDLIVNTNSGDLNLSDLYFQTNSADVKVAETDSAQVSFRLEIAPGQYIDKIYTLKGKGFELTSSIKAIGLDNVITNNPVKFNWVNNVRKVEMDLQQSRLNTTVNYYTADGSFKNIKESSLDPEEVVPETPLKWVAMKQKFFTAAIITPTSFTTGKLKSMVLPNDSTSVKVLQANLDIPAKDIKNGTTFTYYFGPNDYQIAKNVTEGFGNNVYLGWTIFATINKYLIIPIFHFLERFISNYGIIIILLVLIVKLILFPLSYRSYVSMAKIKVLKPELDVIKEKNGDDAQKVQTEQMALYQKVGVNPFSGCIPVLLQMPILLAMFNFFPNSIELRQEPFLWASDLSTYDSIATLPFKIPGYGSHVSLFCLLMTLSTLAYTWFNNQMTTVTGPMKSMQYVMPVIFLFFLNSFSAGLTFYYFVSNVITILQQLFIRQFMVDENKIRQTLEENKLKNQNKKKSRFMSKIEEAMKSAEDAKKISETRKASDAKKKKK